MLVCLLPTKKISEHRCLLDDDTLTLLSINLALSQMLVVLIAVILVVIQFSSRTTFNKLTLLPYQFLLGTGIAASVQYYLTGYYGNIFTSLGLVNIIRTDFYYCAIAIQSFEWLNTWHEIRFQEKFTIAEIPVERRQFQARERMRRNIFFGFITIFFCVSIADELWFETEGYFSKFHQFLNIAANLVDLVFFVIMILLFPRAARKYHRHAYLDYKKRFSAQAFGAAYSLVVNLVINLIIANVIFQGNSQVSLLSPKYLWLQILQMSGLFLFVIQKRPQDLFSDFSKRPDLMFSIFQYPRDQNAERKIKLQENTALLEEKLADKNKNGQLLAVLDEDDILNAEETIKRQNMGIDIDFMVQRLGGTQIMRPTSVNPALFYTISDIDSNHSGSVHEMNY